MANETIGDPFRDLKQSELHGIAGDMMRGRTYEQMAEMKKMDVGCFRRQCFFHREQLAREMVKIQEFDEGIRVMSRDRSAFKGRKGPYDDARMEAEG